MEIRTLQWDSDFFGLRIGRVDILSTDDSLFLATRHEELKQQFDLLYVFDPNNIGFTANVARLVDEKILYSKPCEPRKLYNDIVFFRQAIPSEDLYRLALSSKVLTYSSLVGINLLYACVTIFTKYASQHEFMSTAYCLGLAGAIGVMGAYAIGWQQILKHIEISTAYMFKGTSLIFVMLLAWAFFGEQITSNNIIGAAVIITGIIWFAKE